jgi:hypothetical protein
MWNGMGARYIAYFGFLFLSDGMSVMRVDVVGTGDQVLSP